MNYVPPTIDKKKGEMGFSAEDGLILAVFFAVVLLVALVVRCICIRFCHVKCFKCQHKQDDDPLSTVVVGSSRRSLQSSSQHHFRRAEPEMITGTALLERTFEVEPCSSNDCSLAESLRDDATEGRKLRVDPCHSCRRGRRVSLVPPPSMETLVEEEEGGDPQPVYSKRFLKGAATMALPKETVGVHSVYTFAHDNNRSEVLRTNTTALTSSSCRAPAEAAIGDPPSYEELYPLPRSSEKNPL